MNGAVISQRCRKRRQQNQRKTKEREEEKQIMGPRVLFIGMTWNMKRRTGEPRTSPSSTSTPLGNDDPIFARVALRFPRTASCIRQKQPARNSSSTRRQGLPCVSNERNPRETPRAHLEKQKALVWPSSSPEKSELRSSHNSCSRSNDLGGSYSGLGPTWAQARIKAQI